MADALRSHVKSYRKMKLNDVLGSCGLLAISEVDIDLSSASERTKRRYIAESRELVVAVLKTFVESFRRLVGRFDNLRQDARSL